jgi:CBS domain-containing protein
MTQLAEHVMTAEPQCCSADQPLTDVARLMVEHDCGEIPVVDARRKLVGVVTDRDIVCRIVAPGLDTRVATAREVMSQPVVSVGRTTPLGDVVATMERHRIRRVPVVDDEGCCCGIIAQADVARHAQEQATGELVREVSRDSVAS